MTERFARTRRTSVKRIPTRGRYDRASVYGILDEAFVCHVGFAVDGRPVVIPTAFGRVDDTLYVHGSAASQMLRRLAEGVDVCITVTLVDGLVLARSAFHHSINYRSVVLFGRATLVESEKEKALALRAFSEHLLRGRWDDVRAPTAKELRATSVLSIPLTEASAKVRTGPPVDDAEDYELRVWAGEIPLRLAAGEPVADPRLAQGIDAPRYVKDYRRGAEAREAEEADEVVARA
jgi:nitroimidazol reductase NimA-like FMN-containing flavoprotein (pyridoxamine 5'-phosphate oxidase superfamily)